MSLSRRHFLKSGALVALSAAIPLKFYGVAFGQGARNAGQSPLSGFQTPYESQINPVIYFKKSTFSPYLKTEFAVRLKNKKVMQVALVSVKDAGPVKGLEADAAVGKECFSLIFRAPIYSKRIPQDTYTIEHGALGTFDLFLVPMDKNAQGLYYEALINHRQP